MLIAAEAAEQQQQRSTHIYVVYSVKLDYILISFARCNGDVALHTRRAINDACITDLSSAALDGCRNAINVRRDMLSCNETHTYTHRDVNYIPYEPNNTQGQIPQGNIHTLISCFIAIDIVARLRLFRSVHCA